MFGRTLIAAVFVLPCASFGQSFDETFADVGGPTSNGQLAGANLEAGGWHLQNNSVGGATDWFQGNNQVFFPHSPPGYIAANFLNANIGATIISNWLLTPTRLLRNGDTLSFFTRTVPPPIVAPDRLEVRLGLNGASANLGTSPEDVGDFITQLLVINPNLTDDGYPMVWTQFQITVAGLQAPTLGRFAFRYFVTDAGPSGSNSDYIGIDTVSYTAVPEPVTVVGLVLGVVAIIRRRR